MSNSTSNKSRTRTVKFNVGGTSFEVSRSLLDQHPHCMLTRMASEEWNGSEVTQAKAMSPKPTFIDRNPNRFGFVLDFMRDGKVVLPGGQGQGTSKTSMLEELTYFGFGNVSSDLVQVEFHLLDTAKYAARMDEDFQEERAIAVEKRDRLNVESLP